MDFPTHARVVIVGGGIVGCSVAYHLAKLGCRDVVLIERDTLTCGTTWHAAGVVGALRGSVLLTQLTGEASGLFDTLESETGQATGYKCTGGLSLAQTPARFEELKRFPSIATLTGMQAELLTPAEIKAKSPILNVDDLTGGLWLAQDGQTNPTDTTMALAKGARQNGARLLEHTELQRLETANHHVCAVVTNQGRIQCEMAVICTGMWTRHLGRSLGVSVPLQAVEHMYVVTEPMEEVPPLQPFVRDLDSHVYLKGDAGKLLIGSVDPISKPWSVDGIPQDSSFTMLAEDWDHFEPFMTSALQRVPALERAGIRQFMNGPESFTIDTRHIMGEAPGTKGLFFVAGFNTTGIMTSAGVGKVMAEWLVDGEPPLDLWEVDIQRFEPWMAGDRFIHDRTLESVGLAFAMHWPYRQPETGRGVKLSPLHEQLKAKQACFGVVAGWERPLWYAPEGVIPEMRYSFGAQSWWEHARVEALATRNHVALFDQTQMAVFELCGRDAESRLQELCANEVGVEPGRVVYTQMLNRRGGIEADLTVTRMSEDRFLITTGAPLRVHDHHWIARHLPLDGHLSLTDISSRYAILSIMGPRSRELLSSLSRDALDAESFGFATAKEIEFGPTMVLAQRVSYVGELGFELYTPTEFALCVYQAIVEAGEAFGLKHAGLFCMDCCRLEKGFKHWGDDLSPTITPLEAGLGFAVALHKPFIGREALLDQKRAGLTRRLVSFTVEEGEPLLLHDEPIYRDGILIGSTTSGNRGLTLGGSVCLGLIENLDGCSRDFILSGDYEIQIGDERFPARANLRAPYDASGERMKS